MLEHSSNVGDITDTEYNVKDSVTGVLSENPTAVNQSTKSFRGGQLRAHAKGTAEAVIRGCKT